jgi:RNA polymerase sigma factor (sigma-70 family)
MEPVETSVAGPPVVRTRLPDDFTARFAGLYSSAFQAAYRLLGDRKEADDVAQEACARACLRWDRLAKHGIHRPWIVRKATDLAIRRYQRRQREAQREAMSARSQPPTADGVEEIEEIEEVDERRAALHRALASLPRRRRRAVVLRYIAELSEDDAADALNWAPATVEARARRGIAELRDELSEAAR